MILSKKIADFGSDLAVAQFGSDLCFILWCIYHQNSHVETKKH